MRVFLLAVAFLLACAHPAVVVPPPPPATVAAPIQTPVVEPRAPDPCAPDAGPAAAVLQAFRAELLQAAAKDASAFQQSVQARVNAFREKNRALLMEQAIWSLKRMPRLAIPDLDALPDDARVTSDVAARIDGLLTNDADASSLLSFMGLWSTDLMRAFAGIRGVVLSAVGSAGDLERMRDSVVEGLAPPRIVRVNDDLAHPVLAMPKRADIFVVWFDLDDQQAVFVPKRVRWVRRVPPAEPSADVTSAEEAFLSFAAALEAAKPENDTAGTTAANLAMRTLKQADGLAKRWLDPHASLLREYGACVYRKLPRTPVPDLSGWKESDGFEKMAELTPLFPRLRWDPLQAFLFLRTTIDARTMAVNDYSGIALIDGLVPPTVARGNDDPDHPQLFLVEGDTALLVDFSSSPARGYFPTDVHCLRRN